MLKIWTNSKIDHKRTFRTADVQGKATRAVVLKFFLPIGKPQALLFLSDFLKCLVIPKNSSEDIFLLLQNNVSVKSEQNRPSINLKNNAILTR